MGNIIPFRTSKVEKMPDTLSPEQLVELAAEALKAREMLLAIQDELAVLRSKLTEITEPMSETVGVPGKTGA